jgi:hypothetical protein
MSTYHVSFFKNLLSSDGHPFKCLQGELTSVTWKPPRKPQNRRQRAFEGLYGRPWELHADSIEVVGAESLIDADQTGAAAAQARCP